MTAFEITAPQLRDYQIDIVQQIFECWKYGLSSVAMQLPTGAGKTIIFTAVANEFMAMGEPVLVIAHRTELITQAASKLSLNTDHPIGIIKSGIKPNRDSLIQVASIQTLIRRNPPPASLVIFDEAHHCHSKTYATVMKHYRERGAYILGCTATPARTDGRGLRYLYSGTPGFDVLIKGSSVLELIEQKYLAPFKIYSPSNFIDAANAKIRTTGGDYNQKQLADLVEKTLIIGDAVDTWKQHAYLKRTVLFAVSVKHSKELAQGFRDAGISAMHLDGKTPKKERIALLSAFESGQILVLCQHSIVTEGVDIPGIEAIQLVRPTKSLIVWFQAIGRALRPAPNKETAIIIDHTDTHLNLPWPDDEIEWSLDPISLKVSKWSIGCLSCHHVFRPTPAERDRCLATCPNCNVKFTFKTEKSGKKLKRLKVVEIVPANFAEFDTVYDEHKLYIVQQLIDFGELQGYQKGWIYHQLKELPELELSLGDWREIARRLGYKAGWGWYKWKEMQAEMGDEVA
ncbi:MAG: DEAD/DEAH box helicase [Hydrococcus sp. SU_1_0]|nr:DEAD/DEAH box helicase [Hydrococcus sp. SU_1_0]NJO96039.1 DEAD/DEAH box helicase [Pleurocapsa sp. CRU_1_2]